MAVKKIMPKADTEMSKAERLPPDEVKQNDRISGCEESLESILALLRGVGPVLVGSAPNGAEVQKLVDALKDP